MDGIHWFPLSQYHIVSLSLSLYIYIYKTHFVFWLTPHVWLEMGIWVCCEFEIGVTATAVPQVIPCVVFLVYSCCVFCLSLCLFVCLSVMWALCFSHSPGSLIAVHPTHLLQVAHLLSIYSAEYLPWFFVCGSNSVSPRVCLNPDHFVFFLCVRFITFPWTILVCLPCPSYPWLLLLDPK